MSDELSQKLQYENFSLWGVEIKSQCGKFYLRKKKILLFFYVFWNIKKFVVSLHGHVGYFHRNFEKYFSYSKEVGEFERDKNRAGEKRLKKFR